MTYNVGMFLSQRTTSHFKIQRYFAISPSKIHQSYQTFNAIIKINSKKHFNCFLVYAKECG